MNGIQKRLSECFSSSHADEMLDNSRRASLKCFFFNGLPCILAATTLVYYYLTALKL